MKGLDDIRKGLNGYVGHWNTMSNDDYTGEFRQKNGPLQEYWKGVKTALDAPLQMREALLDGSVNRVNSTFGISYWVLKLVGSSRSSRQ